MSLSTYYVIFDDNNLENSVTGLDVLGIDSYKQPKRSLSVSPISNTNQSHVASGFYTERYINVRIRIKAPDNEILESRIDSLNSLLQSIEKTLVVPQAGFARKYTASLEDVETIDGGGAHWHATLIFRCSDNYGYDFTYTSVIDMTNVSSSTRSDTHEWKGSAYLQAPHIEVYYTAMSGGSGGVVIIGSSVVGQQVTIARDWVAGDRLTIDVVESTVQVNGDDVAFTGALPQFTVGTSNITYYDDFTTRTFDYFVYYYKRWV